MSSSGAGAGAATDAGVAGFVGAASATRTALDVRYQQAGQLDASTAALIAGASATVKALDGRLGTYVSVKDPRFAGGARGDGATDDSAAIAAAVAAVSGAGGTVYFPPGTYLTTTIYSRASNLRMIGAGMGATTLRRLPTTALAGGKGDVRVIAINSVSTGPNPQTDYDTAAVGSYVSNITISDMTVDGNNSHVAIYYSSGTMQGAVYCGQVKGLVVENVYVLNPREIGIHAASCLNGLVHGCTVDGMIGDHSVNSIQVAGDAYDADPGFGFNQRPSQTVKVSDCTVINNPANGGFGVCVQASTGITVTGCMIDFTGNPTGRTCYGIIAEQGGAAAANELGRQYVFSNNYVKFALNGIGAMDNSPGTTSHTATMDGLTLTGNVVEQTINAYRGDGSNITLTGNTAKNCRNGILVGKGLGGASAPADFNIVIVGNLIYLGDMSDATGGNGITINASVGTITGLVLGNNIVTQTNSGGAAGLGLYLLGGVVDFIVQGNLVRDTFGSGIYVAAATATPRRGRIVYNILENVVRTVGIAFPQNRAIANSGGIDVLTAFNHFGPPGAGQLRHTSNINGGAQTILGNTIDAGGPAYNDEASARFLGAIVGAKAGNTAVAGVIAALVAGQLASDSTT